MRYMVDAIEILFFFKQKTAYEMRISDWSSNVCSSDLDAQPMSLGKLEGDRRVAAARHEPPRRRIGGQPMLAQPVRSREPSQAVLAHQDERRPAIGADHRRRAGKGCEFLPGRLAAMAIAGRRDDQIGRAHV